MADDATPAWMRNGLGVPPDIAWSFTTDAPLVDLHLCRETGETVAADQSGGLYLLGRDGGVQRVSRAFHDITAMAWSDSGNGGALLAGKQLVRVSHKLAARWTARLVATPQGIAVDPFGYHFAVCMDNAHSTVFDWKKRVQAEFTTVRPLSFLAFAATERLLIGAAEHGMLCALTFDGNEVWDTRVLTNVGGMAITGDADQIYLAGYSYGVQVFDDGGEQAGSYMVEGNPSAVAATFVAERIAVVTLENHIYWLDADGEVLWAALADEDVKSVACDPLGNGLVCGLQSGRIMRLSWAT